MNGSHARPMTAYAALCAAAVVVLAQGAHAPRVADAIAQAGPPVQLFVPTVTMAMADQVGGGLRDLSASIANSIAPVASEARNQAVRVVGGTATADRAQRASSAARVAAPAMIAPATATGASAAAASTHARAAGAHKAHRAAAHKTRKADRAAAKDTRKAHRHARHRR
ncbi:hypothetical protein GCM10011584_13900 [Nocardioides phosphati]|uniref:Uncharacterized protein n=1 Tax=Nocardioides phosphati TaxID=1867775 RepID=A0ABQ2N8S6_9ACTN|nr:hypothetical protein [Nocardioides phosphati]GGO87979.1 hypothetical protein GCM10011584_13900 [Nocardioides phosphati]